MFGNKGIHSSFNTTASLTINQGGGDKKAGLKPTMAMTMWRNIAYNQPSAGANNLTVLTYTVNPHVNQSRGIGHLPINTPYWGIF